MKRFSIRLALVLYIFPAFALACEPGTPEFRVVVDPGHGGANTRRADDKWDPVTGKYLSPFLYGAGYRQYREHVTMLELSLRVKHYLDWTQSDEGWARFETLLRRFSRQREFPRAKFETMLSRETNYMNHPYREGEEKNAPFRLYDFPDANGRMAPGRITAVNQFKPYLVLSLHMNPAGVGHPGGMAAVLAPGYRTFNMVREIQLGARPQSDFTRSPWNGIWLVTDSGWSQWEAARADAWVHFNGFRTVRDGSRVDTSKNRGLRHNMIGWRYADPPGWWKLYDPAQPGPYATDFKNWRPEGPFWDRERGQAEDWRREGGVMGYGGDNHYATDELMRFVQYGVRVQAPSRRRQGAIGPINPPYVSAYSMPTLVNAVNAYLEIAFINRTRDRELVINYREETARALAVGVYSLFMGLSVDRARTYGPYFPRGRAVDFKRYEDLPDGNYFEVVTD